MSKKRRPSSLQFRLVDWIILSVLVGQTLQIWRLLRMLSNARQAGYVFNDSPTAAYALLAIIWLSGGLVGGFLIVLGGRPGLFVRGFLLGAIAAMTAPLLVLLSITWQ